MPSKAPEKDFECVDLWAFCRQGKTLASTNVDFKFPRMACAPMVFSHQVEKWQMSGSQNRRGESELLIQGTMQADMQCSHCGKGVLYDLEVFRQLRLVKSEQEAEAYEEGLLGDHQDVVACIGLVNLRDWLEDELLLSLPMLARHATCSAPELELSELAKQQPAGFATEGTTNNASAAAPTETETNKPFAALGNLLGRRSK